MRLRWRNEIPTMTGFFVFVLLAGTFGTVYGVSPAPERSPFDPFPADPVPLPPLAHDADRDTYADDVDLMDGDALVTVRLLGFETGRDGAEPYFVAGTQDDHWRLGAGRDLEWRHIVDPDPLGLAPGSPAWSEKAIRTGVWVQTRPGDGEGRSLGVVDHADPDGLPGAEWPQTLILNVRDDQAVDVDLAFYDAHPDPDQVLGSWTLHVDPVAGGWSVPGKSVVLGDGASLPGRDGVRVDLAVDWVPDLDAETKQAIAQRWAPRYHFDSGERFYPTSGDGLERFFGFSRRPTDLRTWTLSFNNGVDGYRLFQGDFDGDGDTDYKDAALLTDRLRSRGEDNGSAPFAPTVYAHVTRAGDGVVLQYWTMYPYNFVLDETGAEVPSLRHVGDREFIQIIFSSVDDALEGRPKELGYSQHFGGIRIPDPGPGVPPFAEDPEHPTVFVGRGGHASYPVAGDDKGFRPSFIGFTDSFDGQGETWLPGVSGEYSVEVLDRQPWFAGYRWGPLTRYDRDLGTSLQPLLAHTFRYAFHDPLTWKQSLQVLEPASLYALYNTPLEDRT